MAYDRDKIKQQLIANIQTDEDITTFEDASATVEPTNKCLYDWEFHKCEDIKGAIASNKVKVKKNLRKQWKQGASTLQLALYKLLATDNEKKALSMEYQEHSGNVGISLIERRIIDPTNE